MSTALVPVERANFACSPRDMSDDSLVAIVIAGWQQFHNLIPHVIELRERFNSRPRGAANIAGCQTWTEFCEKKLDRKIRAVQTAIAAFTNPRVLPKPKSKSSEITDEQLENYEYTNRIEVRKLAKNFIDSGMSSEDAIGALVGLEVPEPYAKATVRILTGSQAVSAEPANQNSMFDLHSALQKAIRRCDEREALLAAWQLDAVAGDKHSHGRAGGLWSILRRICAEDIGLANLAVLEPIERLWRFWEKQLESSNNKHEPWRLFTVEAVMILCASPKSRCVDHACIVLGAGRLESIVNELQKVPQPHPIPAYAHDGQHTGVQNGKTVADFIFNEDAALSPKAVGIEDEYLEEIVAALPPTNELSAIQLLTK